MYLSIGVENRMKGAGHGPHSHTSTHPHALHLPLERLDSGKSQVTLIDDGRGWWNKARQGVHDPSSVIHHPVSFVSPTLLPSVSPMMLNP